MSHLTVLVIAAASFVALFGFIELCERLTSTDRAAQPTEPGGER